jgi:multidrug resistance efflux pump
MPPGARFTIVGGGESPNAIYQARVAQRKVLGDQLDRLNDGRQDLSNRLADPELAKADKAGVEARIATMDARIAEVDKQIANADAQVAQAAGVPGAIVEPPPIERNGPPEEVFVLGGLFIVVVLLPISLAFARRIWRRSAAVVSSLPQEVMDRLTRLDQAVDAIAVEVERIGEGQRFMTRVLAEKPAGVAALGAAVEQRARNALQEEREPR